MIGTILLDVLTPLMLMVLLGVWLRARFNIDLNTLSKLNLYLFVPAFVVHRVAVSELPAGAMAGIFLFTCLQVLLLGALAWLVARGGGAGRSTTSAVILATMIYNSGNIGLPLAELAFPSGSGHDGGAVQALVLLAMNIMTFTLGLAVASSGAGGGWKSAAGRFFRLPIPYALLGALVIRFGFDGYMPVFLGVTLKYLAAGLIPVALVTLGAQLAASKRWPRWRPVSVVLLLRLGVGPVSAALLLYTLHLAMPGTLLDLWPWPAAVIILTSGVPSAVNTLLLTMELEGDAALAADCVFWTTVFSAGTLTLLLLAVRLVPL